MESKSRSETENNEGDASLPDSLIPSVDSTIDGVKLRPLHKKIWLMSSMGIFMEGYNLFVIGIILPLLTVLNKLSPIEVSILAASIILGTIVGSSQLGRLADILGRKKIAIFNTVLIIIFTLLASVSWNLYSFGIFIFLIGVGVGADYPICASYVAEFMPSRIRGKMLIGAFSFQAAGMLSAAGAGYIVLSFHPDLNAWRIILGCGIIPAILTLFLRLTAPESPRWCIEHGKNRKAVRIISQLSQKSQQKITRIVKREAKEIKKAQIKHQHFTVLFSKEHLPRTILAALPWFLMDIATYGIGIFTPMIIASIVHQEHHSTISTTLFSLKGAVFVDLFLILGFITNIFLVDKVGRIKLQLTGFIGMAIGLFILAGSTLLPLTGYLHLIMLFGGFIIYNFLMNMGPNATTFILPAELFPTKLRASAHGFSSAFAKVGAILGIVLIPLMKNNFNLFTTVIIISIAAILGFIVTIIFKVETMGKSLDKLSHQEAARTLGREKSAGKS